MRFKSGEYRCKSGEYRCKSVEYCRSHGARIVLTLSEQYSRYV